MYVAPYLHKSDFYRNLPKDEEEFISKYYKEDNTVNNLDDWILLIQVIDW